MVAPHFATGPGNTIPGWTAVTRWIREVTARKSLSWRSSRTSRLRSRRRCPTNAERLAGSRCRDSLRGSRARLTVRAVLPRTVRQAPVGPAGPSAFAGRQWQSVPRCRSVCGPRRHLRPLGVPSVRCRPVRETHTNLRWCSPIPRLSRAGRLFDPKRTDCSPETRSPLSSQV